MAVLISGTGHGDAAGFGPLVRDVSSGCARFDVLREKRADVLTVRARPRPDSSVIVKLWNRRGPSAVIRRLTGTGAPRREWDALSRLHRAGVPVPRPLAFVRLSGASVRHTDAIVMEDLGETVWAADRAIEMLGADRMDALRALEEEIIGVTAGIVAAGVLDPDHSMMNVVVTPGGRVARLDLEVARCVRRPSGHAALFAQMLARLVLTHFFAMITRRELTADFARRLASALNPPRRALATAGASVRARVHAHCRDRGLPEDLELVW